MRSNQALYCILSYFHFYILGGQRPKAAAQQKGERYIPQGQYNNKLNFNEDLFVLHHI